jgi:SAM-dependent methyltransferase
MTSFDPVVDAYDAARPAYPDAMYDALGPVAGLRVVEGGAGTGLATRALRVRGATVVALDTGEQMLRRNAPPSAVADAARAPLRAGCADLVCFAQAWHWLDHERANAESARLLDVGGRWAGWWSHPRADGEPWFDDYWDVVESMTVAHRSHRDTDWSQTLDTSLFADATFVSVPWLREVSIDAWLTDERSKSYIGLADHVAEVVDELTKILRTQFGTGPVRVRYETWLWQATKR